MRIGAVINVQITAPIPISLSPPYLNHRESRISVFIILRCLIFRIVITSFSSHANIKKMRCMIFYSCNIHPF